MAAVEIEVDGGIGEAQEVPARTRPVRNASYLAAASLGAKVFSFVFVLYAYRVLHRSGMGSYANVTSYVGLFGVLSDLGLGTLATRDVSGDRSLALRYISNLLAVRTLLSLASILLIVVLAQVMIDPPLRASVYVFALGLVPQAVSNTLQLVFQFSERLSYSAAINIVNGAVTAGLGLLILFFGQGDRILSLMVVYTVVTTATAIAAALLVYTRFLPRRLELDPAWWPALIKLAVPFASLTLINVLYYNADRQILQVLLGCNHAAAGVGCPQLGEYSAAYRALDILMIVVISSVNAAVLPAFMRVGGDSRQALTALIRAAGTLALAFGVPVALLTAFFPREALRIVAGKEYLVAAPALSILIWTFPCVMLLTLLYNALYALHRQRIVTMAFAVTLVFNVVANLLFIPHFSYFASAALTVASEVVNGVIVLYALRRELGSLGLVSPALRVGAVAVVTALVLWLLHPLGIVVGLPAGVVVVLLGLRVTRVLGPAEQDILGRLPLFGRYARLLS
jgi:O-antigen/teichoic acid export membrane protein